MTLTEILQEAFNNSACLEKLQESLGIKDLEVNASSESISITFERENKLESLLLKPLLEQVGATQRRTQTGVQHVAGYTRENTKPNIEDLIKAEESDSDIEEKTDEAFQAFIECCLESIDGKSITIE